MMQTTEHHSHSNAVGTVPMQAADRGARQWTATLNNPVSRTITLALALLAMFTHAQTTWHHPPSPYRFNLVVERQGNNPRAGLLLQLPICGMASPSGRDIFVFDESGRQLSLRALGAALDSTTLIQTENVEAGTRLHAYFASQQPAPQNRMAFLQPLICEVRNFPGGELDSFDHVQRLWESAATLGRLHTPRIDLSYNPATADDQFMVEFTGYLNIETAGDHTFMLVSDDAGYLQLDGDLVIEHNGRHGPGESVRGEHRATVKREPGPVKVRVLVAEAGGGQMAVLARYRSGHDKEILNPDDFLRPGEATILAVEARRGPPPPVFTHNDKAYIGYDDTFYTLVAFKTTPTTFESPPAWRFGDGGQAQGTQVQHVFVGVTPREVTVTASDSTAKGMLSFPEMAPAQWHMRNQGHFNTFAQTMLGNNPEQLDTQTLVGYNEFLSHQELNRDVEPICRTLLKRNDLPPKERTITLLRLARIVAANDVDQALKLYREALRNTPAGDIPDWAPEPVELAVFAGHDEAARQTVQSIAQRFSIPPGSFDYLRPYSALIKGNTADFDQQLYTLVHHRSNVEDHRESNVRANALEQRFEDLLAADFPSRARETLQQWEMLMPENHRSGALPLARAKLLVTIGRLQDALALLDKTVERDPLVARLPEIDLQRLRILRRLADHERAEQLRQRIARDYPNHPVANSDEVKKP